MGILVTFNKTLGIGQLVIIFLCLICFASECSDWADQIASSAPSSLPKWMRYFVLGICFVLGSCFEFARASLLSVGITLCVVPVLCADLVMINTEIPFWVDDIDLKYSHHELYVKKIAHSEKESGTMEHWCLWQIIASSLPFTDPLTRVRSTKNQKRNYSPARAKMEDFRKFGFLG